MCSIKKKVAFAHRRGFTLLEVLVALIAVSLFLTMMLPATLASLKRIELSANIDRALFLAKSKMEWLSALPNVPVGVTNGKAGGLSWEITVTDMSNNNAATGTTTAVSLRELKVRVMEGQSTQPLAVVSALRAYTNR